MQQHFGSAVAWGAALRECAVSWRRALSPRSRVRKVLGETEINEFKFARRRLNYDVFSLQVSEHDLLLVQVVEQDQSLCGEELDKLQLYADLFSLEFVQSESVDRLHQEVDMLLAFESRKELGKAAGHEVLLPAILEVT